jgi:hypothetical protein
MLHLVGFFFIYELCYDARIYEHQVNNNPIRLTE